MKKQTLLSIIILILIILGLAPWVTGYLFKNKYLELVAAVNQKYPNMINIVSYRQGWLSSDISLQIKPTNLEDLLKEQSYEATPEMIAMTTFAVNEHVSHGPIVFDNTKKRPTLALAAMHDVLHLPNQIDIILYGKAKPEGFGTTDTLLSFSGTWQEHINIFPISLSPSGVAKVMWDGLSGDVNLRMKNNQIEKISSNIVFGRLSVKSLDSSPFPINFDFLLQPMTHTSEIALQPLGLWTGQSNLSLPGFTLRSSNQLIAALENLSLVGNSSLSMDLYSISNKTTIQKVEVPTNVVAVVSPIKFDLQVDKLNAKPFYQLLTSYKNFRAKDDLNSDEFEKQMTALLPSLISADTTVQLNLFGGTSLGDLTINAQANWPANSPLPKTLNEITENGFAKIDIKISAALETLLLNQFIASTAEREARLLQRMNTLQTAATNSPTEAPSSPQKDIFKDKITALMKQSKLPLPAAIQIMTWFDQHISPAEFVTNIKQFNLSADAAGQLTLLYQQLYVTKAPPQTSAKQPAQPLPIDETQLQQQLATSLKTQFDEMVQQGYIIQSNNDYIVSITYQNGAIKVNDKPIPQEWLNGNMLTPNPAVIPVTPAQPGSVSAPTPMPPSPPGMPAQPVQPQTTMLQPSNPAAPVAPQPAPTQ